MTLKLVKPLRLTRRPPRNIVVSFRISTDEWQRLLAVAPFLERPRHQDSGKLARFYSITFPVQAVMETVQHNVAANGASIRPVNPLIMCFWNMLLRWIHSPPSCFTAARVVCSKNIEL